MSFIGLYAGHFLFGASENNLPPKNESGAEAVKDKLENSGLPVKYRHITEKVKGESQEIHMLEVDLRNERVEVLPVLSHDKVFGFEKLSRMAERSNAYGAVNGGFFHIYGEPSGMVAVNGQLITRPTGKYPVLVVDEKRAYLDELHMKLWLESDGTRLEINDINARGKAGEILMYTPAYGNTNRVGTENITAVIINGRVESVDVYKGETEIPDNGMLVTFLKPFRYRLDKLSTNQLPLKENGNVKILSDPGLGSRTQAYECGSWIVRNGCAVIESQDEWVGVLTNRDPRTVVGLKNESTLVLLTVDGRQPGYSAGLTGNELAELLLRYGIKEAAMLDGGASTEMIVKGRIVNRPSFKGEERPIGGAIVVKYRE